MSMEEETALTSIDSLAKIDLTNDMQLQVTNARMLLHVGANGASNSPHGNGVGFQESITDVAPQHWLSTHTDAHSLTALAQLHGLLVIRCAAAMSAT